MTGNNNLGRGFSNFTHSDLSPNVKPKSEQPLLISIIIIAVSLIFMILVFILKIAAKALKAIFSRFQPHSS